MSLLHNVCKKSCCMHKLCGLVSAKYGGSSGFGTLVLALEARVRRDVQRLGQVAEHITTTHASANNAMKTSTNITDTGKSGKEQ